MPTKVAKIVGARDYATAVLNDGAQWYWPLGESSGSFQTLGSTAGLGTKHGGITYADTALLAERTKNPRWDGVSGTYASFDLSASALTNQNLGPTFEFWFISNGNSAYTFIYCDNFGTTTLEGTDAAGYSCYIGNKLVGNTGPITAGALYHIVIACAFQAGTKKLYVNGSLVATLTSNIYGGSTTLYVGGFKDGISNPFNGWIGHLAVYPVGSNTASPPYQAGSGVELTAAQAAAHYALRTAVLKGLQVSGTGHAFGSTHASIVGSGGVRIGGHAPMSRHVSAQGTGGVRVSGTAPKHVGRRFTGSGGVRVSGAAAWTRHARKTGAGGIAVGGHAVVVFSHGSGTRHAARVVTIAQESRTTRVLRDRNEAAS